MTATIISTLIGGLLALAGSLVGPFLQRRHDRWTASRDDRGILRDKAQELFDELDRIVSDSHKSSMSALARLQDGNAPVVPVPDLGRIRAVAAIYFPSCLNLIDKHEAKHRQMTEHMVDEAKSAVDKGMNGLDTLKSLPMIMSVQYQQFLSEFVKDMRNHLATNVPKLDLEKI